MQSFSKGQKAVLLGLLIAVLATAAVATAALIAPRNQASTSPLPSTTTYEQATPASPVSYSPEPTESASAPATPLETAGLPAPSESAPSEQAWAEPAPSAFQPPAVVASPAPYPTAPGRQALPEPEMQRSCPAGRVRVALTSVTFAPYQYDDAQSVITVKGTVTNGTAAAVTMFDDDVPNFSGLNSRGEPVVIELYGKWDWKPPAGHPRPSFLRLEPGERMSYEVTATSSNSTINDVEYWFSDGQLGSFEASFDFDGPYWDCPDPLPSEGGGASMPATGLPPVTQK